MPKLKKMNIGGRITLVNKDIGVAPYFQNFLRRRVREQKSSNVVVTGEPGEGKSYMAIDICRVLMGLTKTGIDRFKLKQIVFTYSQYLDLIINLPIGAPIVFDEPSYALGKRDWYKDLNKALVLTMESQRFKIHPLFIPVVNKSLLDKTVRSYLIQFQVVLRKRGRAIVYRIEPSQASEKIYRKEMCRLQYDVLDKDLCNRESCLGCNKLIECTIFRARYERKKATIQDKRYESAKDKAARFETIQLTDQMIEKILYPVNKKFVNEEGKIDVALMRIVAEEDFTIKLNNQRSYKIAKALKYHHQNEFT